LFPVDYIYGDTRLKILLTRNELLHRLEKILLSNPIYIESTDNSLAYSSVLVIIHYRYDTPHIILTKRSSSVRVHSGEVCFPGGRFDRFEDRNLLDTAIRETQEELGLKLNARDINGCLQPVRTLTSNFLIYPFVSINQTVPWPVISSREVERIIDAPLYEVLDSISADHRNSNTTSNSELYKFKFENDIVWGATSRILKQLHDHLYEKNNV